jgi:RNA polymerase sigma-70 factor (ECF subfamily)
MQWPSTQSSLVRDIRDGRDHEAWMSFVDVYGPIVYRFCLRQHLQDSDAADVVQNVMTRVWNGVASFDSDRGRFRSWLITIASREVFRHLERRVATRAAADISEMELESALAASWQVEFQTQLFDCAMEHVRREFDDSSWQAFEQVWIQKRKVLDVATELNLSVQRVYRVKRQILERLRQQVLQLENDSTLICLIRKE